MDQQLNQNMGSKLWVLTKLKESTYAIDSTHIEAIFMLDQNITHTAESNDINLGIVSFRDSVLPIVDLRGLLGMQSFAEEEAAFENMLEQRKNDHIHWVNELKRCLQDKQPFNLATDPHKCAFGKWYDNYQPTSHTVAFHLKRIDEPHKKLHQTAAAAFRCEQHCDDCSREKCLRVALKEGTEIYMPQVVGFLEEAKQIFKDSYRRMVVVVSNGSSSCGLIVDEVLSVESLTNIVPNSQLGALKGTRSVSCVALKKEDSELILVLNLDAVFGQVILPKPDAETGKSTASA